MNRISSEDVAQAANVSRATVSYVLNDRPGRRISEATRQRILDAAADLGYVPDPSALALRSGRQPIVLLHEPGEVTARGQDPLPTGSTSGLMRAAVVREVRSWGMVVVSAGAGLPIDDALKLLTPRLVLAPAGLSSEDLALVERSRIPWYAGEPGQSLLERIAADLTRSQVAHLQERGHRRVCYVSTAVAELSGFAQQREAALLRACANLGVDCAGAVRLGPSEESLEACAAALQGWLAQGVTAVATFNDLYAGLALASARTIGASVPEDLAVVGVDDDPMSRFLDPPLSTVALRMAALGTHLAECGKATLEGRGVPDYPGGLAPIVARLST